MQAFEQGLLPLEALKDDDIFEIQHHHLLQCLERATEREFVEADAVPDTGGKLFSTPPLSPAKLGVHDSNAKVFVHNNSL